MRSPLRVSAFELSEISQLINRVFAGFQKPHFHSHVRSAAAAFPAVHGFQPVPYALPRHPQHWKNGSVSCWNESQFKAIVKDWKQCRWPASPVSYRLIQAKTDKPFFWSN